MHAALPRHERVPNLSAYRERLLRRCLATSVCSAVPAASTPAAEGVGGLLDFLQNEASPYEVTVPPYLQVPPPKQRPQRDVAAGGGATTSARVRRGPARGEAAQAPPRDTPAAGKQAPAQHTKQQQRQQHQPIQHTSPGDASQQQRVPPASPHATTVPPLGTVGHQPLAGSLPDGPYPAGTGAASSATVDPSLAAPDKVPHSGALPSGSEGLRLPQAVQPATAKPQADPPVTVDAAQEERQLVTVSKDGPHIELPGALTSAPANGFNPRPAARNAPPPPAGLPSAPSNPIPAPANGGDGATAAAPADLTAAPATASARVAAAPSSVAATTDPRVLRAQRGVLPIRRTAVMWQWQQHLRPTVPKPSMTQVAASAGSTAQFTSVVSAASNATAVAGARGAAARVDAASGAHQTGTSGETPSGVRIAAGAAAPTVQQPAAGVAHMPNLAGGTGGPLTLQAAAAPPAAPAGAVAAMPRVPAALLPLTIQGRIAAMEAARARAQEAAQARSLEARQAPTARTPAALTQTQQPAAQQAELQVPAEPLEVKARPEGPARAGSSRSSSETRSSSRIGTTRSRGDRVSSEAAAASSSAPSGSVVAAQQLTVARAPEATVTAVPPADVGVEAKHTATAATSGTSPQPAKSIEQPQPTSSPDTPSDKPRRPKPTAPSSTAQATSLPPEVVAAQQLLSSLALYRPQGREDGPMDLAPHVRYRHVDFQAAADAAARHPDVLLRSYDAAELSYIAAAYGAAQHVHGPFLVRLGEELLMRIPGVTGGRGRQHGDRSSDGKAASRSGRRGAGARGTQDEAGTGMERGPGGREGKRKGRREEEQEEEELEGEEPFPLSFRQTCIVLTSMARLRWPEGRLMAVLGGRLAAGFRDGEVLPRNRWQGTWLSAGLWAYAVLMRELQQQQQPGPGPQQRLLQQQAPQQQQQQQLQQLPSGGGALTAVNASAASVNTALAAGAALFTEAAELVRVYPGWLHLMDGREALWALWAFRTAAHVLADGGGGLPGGSWDGGAGLGPGAGAAVQAAGAGALAMAGGGASAAAAAAAAAASAAALKLWYEADPLVELKLTERAASTVAQFTPAQLAEAAAAAAEVGLWDPDLWGALRKASVARAPAFRPQPLAVLVAAVALMQLQDVPWLTALAAACRNKMINFSADQIVVVMYSFAVALRFHYAPLFHATAVVSTIPGYERVRQMSAGQTVRLIASYAAVRHYEPILMYKAVNHLLFPASAATPWQRASLLLSLAQLRYRSGPLLRAVVPSIATLQPLPPSSTPVTTPTSPGEPHVPASLPTSPPITTTSPTSATQGPQPAPLSKHPTAPAELLQLLGPPAQLVSTAWACGQLQHRPRGLLRLLHAARDAAWPRLSLAQRATLTWALLALTCLGLAGSKPASTGSSSSSSRRRSPTTGQGGDKAATKPGTQGHPKGEDARGSEARQLQELLPLLCDYVRCLVAARDGGAWPSTPEAGQLLAACHVLTGWRPGSLGLGQVQDVGGGDLAVASSGAQEGSNSSCYAAGGGGAGVDELAACMQRLRPRPVQRSLQALHQGRLATHGSWAEQVSELVRAMAPELVGGVVERRWGPGGGQERVVRVVKVAGVSTGVALCGGAVTVDVCLELKVEECVGGEGNGGGTGGRQRGDGRLWVAVQLCMTGEEAVRNSRWLLAGEAAVRHRLLRRLGWRVAALRQRTWDEANGSVRRLRELVARVLGRAVLEGKPEGPLQDSVG